MIPKFRAWYKKGTLPMLKVNLISFDQQFTHVYIDDEVFAETEMSFDFDDVIFMQSTGLEDKNGTEIFEGDIVEYSLPLGYRGKGKVIFDEEYGWFNIDGFYAGIYDYPTLAFSEGTDNFEVIGNVWEDGGLIDNKNSETN